MDKRYMIVGVKYMDISSENISFILPSDQKLQPTISH